MYKNNIGLTCVGISSIDSDCPTGFMAPGTIVHKLGKIKLQRNFDLTLKNLHSQHAKC